MDKAKFAFGSLANLQSAIDSGAVDAFDLLCLTDEGVAKIGWIDKDGNPVIVESDTTYEDDVVVVDELPDVGVAGIIYVCQNIVYIWDGTQFVSMCNSKELTELTTLVETKVDQETVVQMIEEKITEASGIPVIEF